MDLLGWDELGEMYIAGRNHEWLTAGEDEGVKIPLKFTIALMLKRKTSFSVKLNSTLASEITSP